MASSSTSLVQKSYKYDVFLSFRGEDTRKNFVDHLYQALMDKGIYTYKDDEKIKKGKRISDDLFKSIEDSKFYIIVFSKNYASSSWCLKELVKIMECQKMTGHAAYPVFYDVEPTEVRKQGGAVGEAFAKHENVEAAGKWREGLKEASNLAGWELKNTLDGHQARFIKKIIQEISLELRSINFGFDENLVGMETRVKDVVSSLEVGIDEVRMIGIKGMGGAGKTTTARAVFDHLSNDFEAKSFVGNVREVSKASVFCLKNLQEQVLSDVLNQQVTLNNVDDGKNMMKRMMFAKKVLLVLDDVDHVDQLEALASGHKRFKPGSRIIVTTRDEQVLVAHRVNLIQGIQLLSDKEAICLFSRYAFGWEIPSQGYEELSGKVVCYAAGLPLTVKVLGSFLCGKDMLEWEDAIERLKKIPLKETLEKLELSYNSLEDDYKEIFLDITCILKGEHKKDAIRVLESCGFHARNGLKVLEQRSLITISKGGYLGMHDHIEEMGKNIVRRSHPEEPNKHSRLWINEEIEDILANNMGTEATRCLKLNKSRGNAGIVMKSLGKMKKLRYLEVNFAYYDNAGCLNDTSQYFSNSLRYLKCLGYPFLYLPKTFQANNLVELDMKYSSMVQLWEEGEKKVLKKLKLISLSRSSLKTFDFSITPNLKTLSLNYSFNLKELYMPCQNLKYLNISHSKLRTFDLGLTPNLETLSLRDSHDLVELFMPVSCQKLNYLCISFSKLRTFDLGRLTPNLEKLSLVNCADFVELHVSVACPNLKFLELRNLRLRSLDLELIPNLESLDLAGCDELVEINAPVGCLEWLHVSSKKIEYLPDSICLLKRLKSLNVSKCCCLGKLPEDIGQLDSLERLVLSATRIKHLPDSICMLKRLKELNVANCCRLEKLPEDIGQLESLESLVLWGTTIKHLPDSICMLKRLKELNLSYCVLLEKLPEDLGLLVCLKLLNITDSGISRSHLPQSIFGLKGLCIYARPEMKTRVFGMLDYSSCSLDLDFKLAPKQKIRIKLRSYWVPLIEDSCKQIMDVPRTTNAKTIGPVPLTTNMRIYCVLTSAHVHKDARFHFEIRTHQRLIDILHPTTQTIDSLMQLDPPVDVGVEVKL